jgi:hypothetical protein
VKVNNKTAYRTEDLAAFFRAGLAAAGASTKKHIEVTYSRRSCWNDPLRPGSMVGGCASYSGVTGREGHYIRVSVPNRPVSVDESGAAIRGKGGGWQYGAPYSELPEDVLFVLAQVFEHEVGHNLGLHHREMKEWWKLEPTWHEGLHIRRKEEKAKPTIADKVRKRAEHAMKKLEEHEKKLAREEGLVRKWRAKVRYYQRQGVLPEDEDG